MRTTAQYALASLTMLLTAYHALGQGSEGLGSLRHIQSTREPVVADEAPADSWGSVPTEKTSLINVAPVLER